MPPANDAPVQHSVLSVLDALRAQHPDVPFLALGQTVFWDEPVKAVWRRLLDEHWPGATLIAGVHDTDYFAKTSAHVSDDSPYVALPHDDGRTRDLWSAAGEMSALFGSESVPTRAMYEKHGVPFDGLAKSYPGGKAALLAEQTAAWGWLGIVSTESHSVIAHDVPIRAMAGALREQMDWAFGESLTCLADPASRARAAEVAATVRGWVEEFLADCTDNCRLSDLYQTLVPRFYALLLSAPPAEFQTTASTELFVFNRQTCRRPRFALLSAFLDPKTRAAARRAYDRAVAGSGIYTLDTFGEGALPFDLVIPGVGRGTLRLTARGPVVETAPTPTPLCEGCPIASVDDLARVVEAQFGPGAALVGKAVTLADMIASEFLVVFHETASGYTSLTQAFNAGLAQAGIALPLKPIVRLSYPTWDALAAAPETVAFRLPPHLAASFGAENVTAPAFAERWRPVCEAQRRVLRETAALRTARDLMTYLDSPSAPDHGGEKSPWCNLLGEYERALDTLKRIAVQSATLRERMAEHRREVAVWRREREELERRKGEDWRTNIQPLRYKIADAHAEGRDVAALQRSLDRQIAIRATAFDEPLTRCRVRINATKLLLASFRKQRRLLERGSEALQARATLREIVQKAQMARLALVRDAFLTVEGLEHTNLRPTAWWLPLVDPSGAWFAAIVAGTEARLESLAPA